MNSPAPATVLHYTGYDHARGGIVAIVRALAAENRFACELGVNPGFRSEQVNVAAREFSALRGEHIGLANMARARRVALEVQRWLHAEPRGVFHGHSRAGLLVALWLRRWNERRIVVSVHCYGRQRWFYRWAARKLRDRLFWLSPSMKRYYELPEAGSWTQCVPGCIRVARARPARRDDGLNHAVRIGGVGMLVEWKRWHLVLEAIASLTPAVRARVRFWHIGSATDEEPSQAYARILRERTRVLGLDGIVEWRGEQPGADGLLQEVHCLVVASRREPLSIAMLEALGAGVPVLASRAGGSTDVIDEPRNGWFFAPDCVADLARQIAMLVETDALRRVEVRTDDIARFDVRTVAARWAEIYAAL